MSGNSTNFAADFLPQSQAPLNSGIAPSILPSSPFQDPLHPYQSSSSLPTSELNSLVSLNPVSNPASGWFTVGDSGNVSIDYLFDGGAFEGELGIFSLSGLEAYTLGSNELIQEVTRRVLSQSTAGYLAISDALEGARFNSGLGWEGDFNHGDHLGVKAFTMTAGDRFGIVTVANGTFQDLLQNPNGNKYQTLFSMAEWNPKGTQQFGQLTSDTGDTSVFAFEDLRLDGHSDRDYNDMVFQIRGATATAIDLSDLIDDIKDWQNTAIGTQIIDHIRAIELPTLPIDPATGAEYYPGDLLVQFAPNASPAEIQAIAQQFGAIAVESLDPSDPSSQWQVLRFAPDTNLLQVRSELSQNTSVGAIDLNYKMTVDFSRDPLSTELWGLNNTGQSGGRVDADIDLPEAWRFQTGSPNVTVAVIDTGIDYRHPDLAANIWRNTREIPGNGVDDDRNGFVDDVNGFDFANRDNNPWDDNGHGTHVAGTIGAVGNNNVGVAGINRNVKLMPLKSFGSNGSASLLNIVSAVNYATTMGAKIINASFGGGGYSQAMFDAVQRANRSGVLFVAAAGNNGRNTDFQPQFPAAYNLPNVISVAATDRFDQRANFSNYGRNTVDLGAPGVDVVSTLPNNRYGSLDGTSMAAPHVAGVAALLYAQNQTRSATEVRDLIFQSGDRTAAMQNITSTGTRLNANNAVIRGMLGAGSRSPQLFRAAFDTVLGQNYDYAPIGNAYRWGNGWTQELRDSRGNRVLIMLEDGANTAYTVLGSNLDEYLFMGGPVGKTIDGRGVFLGYPRSNENVFTNGRDGKRGVWQQFAADDGKARIHNLFGSASVATWGSIGSRYTDMGGASSWLGMPTRREYFDGNTVFADFQGGRIAFNWDTGWLEVLQPGAQPSWRQPVGNPDIDIQLDFYGTFSQSQRNIIEQAARNWENIITRDKVPSGVLRIAVTQGTGRMNGSGWNGMWAETSWTDYGYQRNARYDLTPNLAGEVRMHYNSSQMSRLTSNQLTRLTMHELGHALGLDDAQYDPSLGMDGIMDLYGLDPKLTEGVFQRMEWMGYSVNRNAAIAWG